MNHAYAQEKLKQLIRDLRSYTAEEFWRQTSRIVSGATDLPGAEQLQADLKQEQLMRYDSDLHLNAAVEHIKKLESERDELRDLACERATFIVNGVDLGYIRLPTTPDPALDVYDRCIGRASKVKTGSES